MKEWRKKMSSTKEQGTRVRKKPYVKPEIKQVPLRPEEAVLAACKAQQSAGPAGGFFHCSHGPGECSTLGS
jgi:hypothetical protein